MNFGRRAAVRKEDWTWAFLICRDVLKVSQKMLGLERGQE